MNPSTFLQKHVNDLKLLDIDYVFLRNSDGYPEQITGDVDLLVSEADLQSIYTYYKSLDAECAIGVEQVILRKHDLYVFLYFPLGSERRYLVMEYYTGLIYRGCKVLAGESLFSLAAENGPWRHLQASPSITYTFFHYVIYKGYLPQKYKPLLLKHGLNPAICDSISGFLREQGRKFSINENTEKLALQMRSRISKRAVFAHYLRQIYSLRTESFGRCIRIHDDDVSSVLEFAEKYHLYRPTHRYVIRNTNVFRRLKSVLIVVSGGLVVIPDLQAERRGDISEYFDARMLTGGWSKILDALS